MLDGYESELNPYTMELLDPSKMASIDAQASDVSRKDVYKRQDYAYYLMLASLFLPLILCFLLWLVFGRDPKIRQTEELTVPAGMTPAEAGYIIDGAVDSKDIFSLILYWADRGYLSIEELQGDHFRLKKMEELGGEMCIRDRSITRGIAFSCAISATASISGMSEFGFPNVSR